MNKCSKVNLINNTTTDPHTTVNEDGISDSGSTLHCYRGDTPTYNYFPDAALHAVKPDRSKIVSTFQADMKVSKLYREEHRGYKCTTLTQNLVLMPVLAYNRYTIILDITRINVMKVGNQAIEGYREHHIILWRLKI